MKIFTCLSCILLLLNVISADDYYVDADDEDDRDRKENEVDDEEETLQAKLELIDMDLADICDEMAVNLRKSLLQVPVNFSKKVITNRNT